MQVRVCHSKRKFGSKDKKQSCEVAWFDKYDWLYYDAADSARPSEQGQPRPPNFPCRFFGGLCIHVCHARAPLTWAIAYQGAAKQGEQFLPQIHQWESSTPPETHRRYFVYTEQPMICLL